MNNDTSAPVQSASYAVADVQVLKQKMLSWACRFNIFLFLDSQQYHFAPHRYECLLAAGCSQAITNDLDQLHAFVTQKRWCFGHLSYDLKNAVHGFKTAKPNEINFPPAHFFIPQIVVAVEGSTVRIEAPEPEDIWNEINAQQITKEQSATNVHLQPKLSRETYIQIIKQLQQHILRGDCYEINFCQEFFAEKATLQPVHVFQKLSEISPAPFAALYKLNDQYLISVSPERYITKIGGKLITQPMKGTAGRNLHDAAADEALKKKLYTSPKERSENVMIVDLMRNDLSQVCKKASVRVDELFGMYTFPQVHQMVSTISGEIAPDISFTQLLKALFPMGSMTGAPKRRVMELIDAYEPSARGLFSGSVGYFSPDGDFDFNVIIRSILYNAASGHVSCPVGSGITFYSDAESEWEECLVKVAAIRKVLNE